MVIDLDEIHRYADQFLVECGDCGGFHLSFYYGDCRDDGARFADHEEFVRRVVAGIPTKEP